MDIGTLTGEITLEDRLSGVMKSIDGLMKTFGDTSQQQAAKFQSSMTAAAAVGSFFGNVVADMTVRAVSWFKNLVTGSAMAGARLEQLGVATRFMGEKAGYSAQFIDQLAREIEDTGISGIETRDSILQLLGANIKLENAAKLSAIAQNIQGLSGRSSSDVFQVLARAIATGNTMLLRNIGITDISIDGLNRMRKETTGVTGAMTGAERSTAILNAILEKGAGFMGLYGANMETAGKQASSASRAWAQVSEQLGTVLLPITNVVIKSWYALGQAVRDFVRGSQADLASTVQAIASGLQTVINKAGTFVSLLVSVGIQIYSAYQALPQVFKDFGAAALIAAAGVSVLSGAMKSILVMKLASWAVAGAQALSLLGSMILGFGWAGFTLTIGSWGTTIAAFLGPVGLAVIAAGALYAALKYFDLLNPLVAWFKDLASFVGSAVVAAFGSVRSVVETAYGFLSDLAGLISGPVRVGMGWLKASVEAQIGTWDQWAKAIRTVAGYLGEFKQALDAAGANLVQQQADIDGLSTSALEGSISFHDWSQQVAVAGLSLQELGADVDAVKRPFLTLPSDLQPTLTAFETMILLAGETNDALGIVAGKGLPEIADATGDVGNAAAEAGQEVKTFNDKVDALVSKMRGEATPESLVFAAALQVVGDKSAVAATGIQNFHGIITPLQGTIKGVDDAFSKLGVPINQFGLAVGQTIPRDLGTTVGSMQAWQSSLQLAGEDVDALNAQFTAHAKHTQAAEQATKNWNVQLQNMSQAFANLSQIMGGTAGQVVKWVGTVTGAMNVGTQSAVAFNAGGELLGTGLKNTAAGAMGMATGVAGMVGAMDAATSSGSKTANVLGGIATGAQIGMQIAGPWGAAVGAAAGAIVGAFRGIPTVVSVADEAIRDFDVTLSETLAEDIADLADTIGDRSTAIILNLANVAKDAGGVTLANVGMWTQKTRDLFSFVERGQIDLAQAQGQLNQMFPQLAAAAIQAGGTALTQFQSLIDVAQAFGADLSALKTQLESDLVAAFDAYAAAGMVAGSATETAFDNTLAIVQQLGGDLTVLIPSIETAIGTMLSAVTQGGGMASQALFDMMDAAQAAGIATADMAAFVASAQGQALTGLAAVVTGTNASNVSSTTATANAINTTWAAMLAAGVSTNDIMKALGGPLTKLRDDMIAARNTGTQAFKDISAMAAYAGNTVANNAVTQINNATSSMLGLHNSRALTQTGFSALEQVVLAGHDALVKQGQGGRQALQRMQPDLQTIWQLQQDFGYQVDDSTQQLIDQGVKAGLVGNAHRSAADQTILAMHDVASRIGDLIALIVAQMSQTSTATAQNQTDFGNLGNAAQDVGDVGITTIISRSGQMAAQIHTDAAASIADFNAMEAAAAAVGGESPSGIEIAILRMQEFADLSAFVTPTIVHGLSEMQEAAVGVADEIGHIEAAMRGLPPLGYTVETHPGDFDADGRFIPWNASLGVGDHRDLPSNGQPPAGYTPDTHPGDFDADGRFIPWNARRGDGPSDGVMVAAAIRRFDQYQRQLPTLMNQAIKDARR